MANAENITDPERSWLTVTAREVPLLTEPEAALVAKF